MTTTPMDLATSSSTLRGDLPGERGDLLETLRMHRGFLRHTLTGLSEEQARATPTASALSVGGIVKHVVAVEKQWADFCVEGAAGAPQIDWESIDWANPPEMFLEFQQQFVLGPDETVEGTLAAYDEVAAATDALVANADLDLDRTWVLPAMPWFEKDGIRSVRRSLYQIVAETAQHSGHADIIRETIDGQTTMA